MSYTIKTICEVNYPEGLGEVIRIKTKDETTTSETYGTSTHKEWDVYFKPNNGVLFDGMYTQERLYDGQLSKSDTYYDAGASFSDSGIQTIGCMWLCTERESTYSGDGTSSTTTERFTLQGDVEWNLKVKVHGDTECQNMIFFTSRLYARNKTLGVMEHKEDITHIYRKSVNPHAYTNIVAFDSEYDFQGNDLPQNMSYIYPTSMNSSLIWKNSEQQKMSDSAGFYLRNSTPNNTDTLNLSLHSNANEPSIKCVLLYVDSFFLVFSASYAFNKKSQGYSVDSYECCTTSEQQSSYDYNLISNFRVPISNLKFYGKERNCKLYADKAQYEASLPHPPDSPTNYMVQNGDNTIPNEHRWIECVGIGDSTYIGSISRWYNVVLYMNPTVDEEDEDDFSIKTTVSAKSPYARFTDYWVCRPAIGCTVDNIVLNGTEDGMLKYMWVQPSNYVFYPVFKPFAECDFTLYSVKLDNDGKKIPDAAFPKDSITFYRNVIDSNYTSLNPTKIYRKRYEVDTHVESGELSRNMRDFAMTVSPYKNQFWYVHGWRKEYDVTEYGNLTEDERKTSKIGRSSVCVLEDKDGNARILSDKTQQKFENLNHMWNPGETSLGLFVNSCFGMGLRPGIHRRENAFDNWVNEDNIDQLPWQADNMFCVFSTCATLCSWADGENDYICGIMKYLYGNDVKKCSEMTKQFNDIVDNCSMKTFSLIRDFYDSNYDLMHSLLATPEDQTEWDETYDQILADLWNNGENYACQEDWRYTCEASDKSDNFFDPQTKKYKINDGFYGYIKQDIFSIADKQNRRTRYWFKDYQDSDELEHPETLTDKIDELNEKKAKLKNDIYWIYDNALGLNNNGVAWLMMGTAFSRPTMVCTGRFERQNAQFLKNPNASQDNWLRSDDDLASMRARSTSELMNL